MMKRSFVFRLVLMMSALVMFSHCKGPESQGEAATEEPAYHPRISGFTSGTISATSSIRVLLTQELERDVEPMAAIPEKLFSFSPGIKGEAYWVDNKTIEFRPEGVLPSGQHFKADFRIGQLMELPAGQRVFSFSFNIIPQSFSLELKGFEAYDMYDPTLNVVKGVMHTADFLAHETAVEMIRAKQNGRSLPVSWEHDASGRGHTFTIDSVQRLETPAEVLVEAEGKPAGIEQKEQQVINIPAIGDFSLVDVRVVQQPEQYIAVIFSDPLKKNQNLQGLIHFQDDQNLRYLIEGNEVRVYPGGRLQGTRQLHIEEGIRSHKDYRFTNPAVHTLAFEDIKPALRLTGKGVIMPESEGLIFPFEAVNLSKVDVRVIRIYEDNVAQFLQQNQLSGEYQIKRAGRLIHRQTITLSSDRPLDTGKWNAFSLDLAEIIKTEPGAIYRVELGFLKNYSTWPCPDQPQEGDDLTSMNQPMDDDLNKEMAYYDAPNVHYEGYDSYYAWNWAEEDNPCHDAYYGKRRWVSRNVLASDLGIIAKAGTDHSMTFAVTALSTTKPMSDVTLEVYNFQQQLITSVYTDNEGLASVKLDSKPFLLVAKHKEQRGYLRLDDGSSLSLSRFDVDGNKIQHGIKGFIYGERGVWRPGDSLFVMFVLEDRLRKLPADHPVVFEMINPMGQVVQRLSRTQGQNGFYRFSTATGNDAPTGNWRGKVTVGGVTFSKILKVEAIKPNRLKIDLDFGKDKLVAGRDESATLKVNWLHGAVARNLRANVAVTLQQVPTQFPEYRGFVFDDPSRSFSSEEITIFEGRINEQGQAEVTPDFGVKSSAPGMLKAGFVARVFEESGDFSIDRFSMPYSPFRYYVGIRPPEGRGYNNMLETDADHKIEVVTVDADSQPVSRNNLEVQVYKIEWRWWWDASENNLASYIGSSRAQLVHTEMVSTTNGKGEFVFRINEPDWGRYLVRVSDPQAGHSTGKVLYIDWPGWAGRARTQDPSAAAMLSFTLDKEKYQVGDPVTVTIPAGHEGRVLVSLETGSRVLRTFWAQASGPETTVNFQATPEMTPNAYVHVSLVQPHSRMTNDLPIRLYGVMPLFVEDPATLLQPQIKMPGSLTPEEMAEVQISEASGKKMAYTIAMVDEGLLDLTRFATPDAWSSFYAREALGVRTWDMYDHVLGAFGGRIEKVFSIGGDEDAGGKPEVQANRFPPMVRFMGPFTLEKGSTNKHSVSIPKYVGSVRVMVVAGNQGAYGNAEKSVPVKKPLMVLATLPRVLTPAETVKLPVTVF
ncbi:MAG: MG2 domain-containing protein, partial [Bacteroidales bacterium]